MRRAIPFSAIPAICIAVLVQMPALASQCNTSAQASFNDTLGTSYSMHSDGLGPYVDGTQNVKAIIDCSGDFDLDTSESANQTVYRHVWVDLTGCVPGSTCTPPFSSGYQDIYFSTGTCGPAGCNLLGMTVGTSESVGVQVNLPYGNTFLRFNPKLYAETSWVTVTRTGSGSWMIQAVPDATTGAYPIAKLVRLTKNGTYVDEGDYNVTFQISISLK